MDLLFLCHPNATLRIKDSNLEKTTPCLLWKHEKARLHVDSAELCNTARELEVCLHTFEDSHVGEADFSDELEFGVLGENGNGLCDFEHGADDVVARVTRVPKCCVSLMII